MTSIRDNSAMAKIGRSVSCQRTKIGDWMRVTLSDEIVLVVLVSFLSDRTVVGVVSVCHLHPSSPLTLEKDAPSGQHTARVVDELSVVVVTCVKLCGHKPGLKEPSPFRWSLG